MAAAVLLVAVSASGWLAGGPLSTSQPVPPGQGVLVAQRHHVVQAGDSLWSIARSIVPQGDVRPVVDRLVARRGTAPLTPGEVVVLDW